MKVEWDLTRIYKNKEEWEIEKNKLEQEIETWKLLIENMLKSTKDLQKAIQKKIEVESSIEKVYCYPRRFLDLDNQNEEMASLFKTAQQIYGEILKQTKVFTENIIARPQLVEEFLKENPYYIRLINQIRKNNNDYQNEQIENLKEIYRILTEIDLTFGMVHNEKNEEVKLTRKLFQELMICPKEEVRKEALIIRNESYQKIQNTLAVLLNQKYRLDIKNLGPYKSVLEKSLSDLELPSIIVLNLIEATNKNRKVLREYTNLKKEFLGKKELHIYDTSLPLGLISKIEYELEEGIEIIKNALAVLGSDYKKRIEAAFQEGWIDIQDRKNKRKTSYSCISYHGVPYASLIYTKSIVSLRNLIHELGHSIHTSYAKENPFEYFEYSLFLSEVVSKVNEILLNDYLLENNMSKEEQIFLLNNIISSLGNTLFSQTMLTEFEYNVLSEIEANKTLNAEALNQLYRNIFEKYYEDTITLDVDNSQEWTRIPHFMIQSPYYLYQYPIGVSLAIEIVRKLKENKDFSEKYIQFLKIGNTKNIIDSLKELEIDVENPKYIENAFTYLENKIKTLKKVKKDMP